MELPIDDFNFLKQCLKTFDYPCINQMSDIEIRKLFDKDNRVFLITWMMTKYMPEYIHRLDLAQNRKRLEQSLATLLFENGFCKSTQKEMFTLEGIDIDTTNQMKMFKTFFRFLSLRISYHSNQEHFSNEEIEYRDRFVKLTKETLEKKIECDVQLFPSWGTFKKLNKTEQKELTKLFKTSIENSLELKDKKQCLRKVKENVSVDEDKLINDMENFERVTNQFINTCTDTVINCEGIKQNYSNSETLEKCIKGDAEHLNKTLVVLEKKNKLIQILQEKHISDQTDGCSADTYSGNILKHYVSSEYILDDLRNISIV